jgi:hypothetical protein
MEGIDGLGPTDRICRHSAVSLKVGESSRCIWPEDSVNAAKSEAEGAQESLEFGYVVAALHRRVQI